MSLEIAVPIHGQLATTLKLVESIDRQTSAPGVVFYDDHSEDDSIEVLRGLGFCVDDCSCWGVRPYFNGILDDVLASQRSPYLAFLNNDLILGKHFVEDVTRAFEEKDYDLLVPETIPSSMYHKLDHTSRTRIRPLDFREGWAMLFRTASFVDMPPIPEDLRLWFGDDWVFYHAREMGLKVGHLRNVPVYHEGSVTTRAVSPMNNLHPVMRRDIEVFLEKYSYIQPSAVPLMEHNLLAFEEMDKGI